MTMNHKEILEAYKGYQRKQLLTHCTMRVHNDHKKRFDDFRFDALLAAEHGLNKLTTNQFMKLLLDTYEQHIGWAGGWPDNRADVLGLDN